MTKTRTEDLVERLVAQAEIVRDAKTPKKRAEALARLSQTMFLIARPVFNARKLVHALNIASDGELDSMAALQGKNSVYIRGDFDINKLSEAYFVDAVHKIEGSKK